MKKIAIIPSRYGSTRFEGKPLKKIAGISMLERVYSRVKLAKNLDAIYIATDNELIKQAAVAFGAEVIMTPEQAQSGSDRIAFAANSLGLDDEDLIVNIQGDQPLIHPESIDDVLSVFLSKDYDKSFLMSTLSYGIIKDEEIFNPKDVKVVSSIDNFAIYFSRAPIPFGRDNPHRHYFKHLGVYAYTKKFVDIFHKLKPGVLEDLEKLEQLRALEQGYKIKIVETKHDSPEVDEISDIEAIEKILLEQ